MLLDVNADAAMVYQVAKRQVRVAHMSGEVIDLDYAAVKAIMDIYEIKDQKHTFSKVTQAFHHFLSLQRARGK